MTTYSAVGGYYYFGKTWSSQIQVQLKVADSFATTVTINQNWRSHNPDHDYLKLHRNKNTNSDIYKLLDAQNLNYANFKPSVMKY